MYILDVIFKNFAPRTEGLSVYEYSFPEKETSRVVEEMANLNTPLKFLGLS